MIVADTSLLGNLLIPGLEMASADAVAQRDSNWCAPSLWRYELKNTLLKYIRAGTFSSSTAEIIFEKAAKLIASQEPHASTAEVLHVAATYKISAYDAEYVALAQQLRVPLVTFDQKLVRAAPGIALSPEEFLR